jgi:hypothetical protein
MELGLLVAAAGHALAPSAAVTAEQAIERQRDSVLDAISPCRRASTEEEIVVCGQRNAGMPDLSRLPGGSRLPRSWAAPERGPWFEVRRGPLSLTCCSVEGGSGTGAGLALRLGF